MVLLNYVRKNELGNIDNFPLHSRFALHRGERGKNQSQFRIVFFLTIILISPSLFSMEKPPEPMEISVTEVSPIQKLPLDIKAYISTFLTHGSGRTRASKLHNAAETLRDYMMLNKSFATLITNVKTNKELVAHLSRYTGGNLTQAGLALATMGAREYLESLFCNQNRCYFPIDQEINWAAAQGDDSALKVLIKCHYNDIPEQARKNAACGGHLSTVELLYGPEISVSDVQVKDSPLIMACRNGHTHVAQKLLQNGEDPCYISQEWSGSTALYEAAKRGHLDCVNLLLTTRAKTQIDFHDQNRRNALMCAAEYGHSQIVKVLLAAGAQVNLLGFQDLTALSLAVGTDCSSAIHITIVQDLLAAGALVNICSRDGRTALSFARKGQKYSVHKKEIEKILLAHGAH
jgi:Ankyrin repeats (3 copies)